MNYNFAYIDTAKAMKIAEFTLRIGSYVTICHAFTVYKDKIKYTR